MSPQLAEWLRDVDDPRKIVSRSLLERIIAALRAELESCGCGEETAKADETLGHVIPLLDGETADLHAPPGV